MNTLNSFSRLFKTNSDYHNFEDVACIESLAFTVQEFLYTSKAEDDYENYNMDNHIKLFDLMSLTTYFIRASTIDLGKATIKGYIQDLKKQKHSYRIGESVEYVKDDALLVTEASFELIEAILWAAYLYIRFRSKLEEGEDETWTNAEKMLYDLMQEEYPYREDLFKESFFVINIDAALEVLFKHWLKMLKKTKESTKEDSDSKQESDSQLQTIIDEQQAQIEKLKADNALIPQLRQKVVEQNELLKAQKKQALEENVPPANSWEKVIFFANVLSSAYNDLFTNQQALSELICLICGGRPSTFQPRISKLAKMSENDEYSQEVTSAAKNLISRLNRVPRNNKEEDSIIQNYINNIKAEFSIK